MAQGWISIHRQLQCHWLWDDKPFSKGQAWIDMLLLANHADNKFLFGNELIEVQSGSFITSELKLMERWGWSKAKVRAFLQVLEKDKMIVKKTDRKKTTITIENYGVFQDSETTKEPKKDHGETTERPQKDTNNNVNNDNNDNNKKHCASDNAPKVSKQDVTEFFESVWKLYPNKKGKGQVSDSKKKSLYKIGIEEMTRAIERYKAELKKEEWRQPQHGSTFFNSGYVDYLDTNYEPSGTGNQNANTGYPADSDQTDLDGVWKG